jgi:hypothetical protein
VQNFALARNYNISCSRVDWRGEAWPTEMKEITAASRATDEIIRNKKCSHADYSTGCTTASRSTTRDTT